MASTMPPVQAPPPPARHRRSFSGPIILIGVGVLFLLGTLGVIDWHRLGDWFAHYWPVLLILIGIGKLIDYQQAQRSGGRASGLGAGGVFLIIVLIIFGMIATQASRFDWERLRDEINIDDSDFPLFGHTYNYDDQLAQDFPAGGSLQVNDIRGAISINAGTDNQIRVVVHKRIGAENQQQADQRNSQTKPQFSVNGTVVTLNANNQGGGDHGIATDLNITLPRKASVVVSSRHGEVSVVGRDGDVNISNQHGDITATDINGKVSANLDQDSARISQVTSDVSLDGRGDEVSISDVKGTVQIHGEFDDLKLEKIAKDVSFRSERTDLEFARLDGDLDMDSGDLRASDLAGPLHLTTHSKDIRLSGFSGDLHLDDANGSVELHINKLGGIEVENRRGDVELYLPDKAGFQMDARAQGGDIDSDFDALKVSNSNDLASAVGNVGGGGPRIMINDEHGSIEIRKGSSVAEMPEPPAPPKPHARGGPDAPKVTEN